MPLPSMSAHNSNLNIVTVMILVNTMRPEQDGCNLADAVFSVLVV